MYNGGELPTFQVFPNARRRSWVPIRKESITKTTGRRARLHRRVAPELVKVVTTCMSPMRTRISKNRPWNVEQESTQVIGICIVRFAGGSRRRFGDDSGREHVVVDVGSAERRMSTAVKVIGLLAHSDATLPRQVSEVWMTVMSSDQAESTPVRGSIAAVQCRQTSREQHKASLVRTIRLMSTPSSVQHARFGQSGPPHVVPRDKSRESPGIDE
ncbi:hypothetical protein C8F01DRAFT_1271305 [Mycena amicta]|nr:hypothetical protein C8F01DRAFT_1271305 [Mycena amicta]